MKYGIREICDVVLKRKADGWFGKLYLEKGAPVLYFDTLKTSSLEGTSTTVYAQGGKGNPRLVAWDGDRTVTFTMEDALISPESFTILSGAGFVDASENNKLYVHTTEQVEINESNKIELSKLPSTKGDMYIMAMDENGNIDTNCIPMKMPIKENEWSSFGEGGAYVVVTPGTDEKAGTVTIDVANFTSGWIEDYTDKYEDLPGFNEKVFENIPMDIKPGRVVYVDYYVEAESSVKQIEIEAGKFGGSYYLEGSTLWRDQGTGEDYPAEFIIPNCKIQSNFNFTMASTGDPSTFTFTMDAFPDYTNFDKTKKVIAAVQIVEDKDNFGAIPKQA